MTTEEIKAEVRLMQSKIESASLRLDELRKMCKHEKTFEGNYSYRIGNIQLAEICDICGVLIKYK